MAPRIQSAEGRDVGREQQPGPEPGALGVEPEIAEGLCEKGEHQFLGPLQRVRASGLLP